MTGVQTCALPISDLNKDGLSDLVVAENAPGHSRVYVFLQRQGKPLAAGVQDADQAWDIGDACGSYSLAVADLNADGFPDLVLTSSHGADPGVVRGFLNDGKY